jgi:hypothetical protein
LQLEGRQHRDRKRLPDLGSEQNEGSNNDTTRDNSSLTATKQQPPTSNNSNNNSFDNNDKQQQQQQQHQQLPLGTHHRCNDANRGVMTDSTAIDGVVDRRIAPPVAAR